MKVNHDIVTKAVAFNILDPDQKNMLDHAMKRKNFSAYIKRLIQRDIDGAFVAFTGHGFRAPEQEKETVSLDDSLMGGLL